MRRTTWNLINGIVVLTLILGGGGRSASAIEKLGNNDFQKMPVYQQPPAELDETELDKKNDLFNPDLEPSNPDPVSGETLILIVNGQTVEITPGETLKDLFRKTDWTRASNDTKHLTFLLSKDGVIIQQVDMSLSDVNLPNALKGDQGGGPGYTNQQLIVSVSTYAYIKNEDRVVRAKETRTTREFDPILLEKPQPVETAIGEVTFRSENEKAMTYQHFYNLNGTLLMTEVTTENGQKYVDITDSMEQENGYRHFYDKLPTSGAIENLQVLQDGTIEIVQAETLYRINQEGIFISKEPVPLSYADRLETFRTKRNGQKPANGNFTVTLFDVGPGLNTSPSQDSPSQQEVLQNTPLPSVEEIPENIKREIEAARDRIHDIINNMNQRKAQGKNDSFLSNQTEDQINKLYDQEKGEQLNEALDSIIKKMNDPNTTKEEKSAYLDLLKEWMHDDDPMMRAKASETFGKLADSKNEETAELAFGALLELLHDEDSTVATQSVTILSGVNLDQSKRISLLDELTQVMQDPKKITDGSIKLLGSILYLDTSSLSMDQKQSAFSILVSAFISGDTQMRKSAVQWMGQFSNEMMRDPTTRKELEKLYMEAMDKITPSSLSKDDSTTLFLGNLKSFIRLQEPFASTEFKDQAFTFLFNTYSSNGGTIEEFHNLFWLADSPKKKNQLANELHLPDQGFARDVWNLSGIVVRNSEKFSSGDQKELLKTIQELPSEILRETAWIDKGDFGLVHFLGKEGEATGEGILLNTRFTRFDDSLVHELTHNVSDKNASIEAYAVRATELGSDYAFTSDYATRTTGGRHFEVIPKEAEAWYQNSSSRLENALSNIDRWEKGKRNGEDVELGIEFHFVLAGADTFKESHDGKEYIRIYDNRSPILVSNQGSQPQYLGAEIKRDEKGRITRLSMPKKDGSEGITYSFTYNHQGNFTSINQVKKDKTTTYKIGTDGKVIKEENKG